MTRSEAKHSEPGQQLLSERKGLLAACTSTSSANGAGVSKHSSLLALRRCLGYLFLAALVVGSSAIPLGAPFEVEGEITWARQDRIPLHTYQFKVYVNGSQWLMVVRDNGAMERLGEVNFACDGTTNLYGLFYANPQPLAVAETNVIHLTGKVYTDPDNIPFSPCVPGCSQVLWFAFASANSFRTNHWDSLPSGFCVDEESRRRLPAQFLRDPGHANCVVGYRIINPGQVFRPGLAPIPQPIPFDKGFIWQEFQALSLTNHGDILIPLHFTVTTYKPKPNGLSTNELGTVSIREGTVRRVVWDCPVRDPRPPLLQVAAIQDYRIGQLSGLPVDQYSRSDYVATNWFEPGELHFQERVQIMSRVSASPERSAPKSGSPASESWPPEKGAAHEVRPKPAPPL